MALISSFKAVITRTRVAIVSTVTIITGHARMKVFLLRHTEAAFGGPDPQRELTPKGHRFAQELTRHMQDNTFYDFSEAWISPYLRAQQTAAPILKWFNPTPTAIELDALVPYGDISVLLNRLNRSSESVLLVGHNPLLADLGRTLMGLPEKSRFPFKKGALLVLKRDPAQHTRYFLAAHLTPASLGIRA
jgi:phosphohistidine phosphatase